MSEADFSMFKSEITDVVHSVFSQTSKITRAKEIVVSALEGGSKLLWCGNGGSAAEAQHMSAEYMVRFMRNRGPLASVAMSTDTSLLTAHSNDYEYESIFSRQVAGLGKPGDILFAISTSGKSPNVVNAIHEAKSKDMIVIGFFGAISRPEVDPLCDLFFHIDSKVTARIQEGHTMINHMICDLVDRHFAQYQDV